MSLFSEQKVTSRELKFAYDMGFDCGYYGANTINSHFSLFDTKEKVKAWQKGYQEGEKRRDEDNKTVMDV